MKYTKLGVLLFFSFLLAAGNLPAQAPVKEFFNEEWKQCDSALASYYRVITYNEAGQAVGTVKDFYISGEIQWEGGFSFIDKYDSYKSKHEGTCTWYYKNGKKENTAFYVDGVRNGVAKGWYENGTTSYECTYKNDALEGMYISWFESGLLQAFAYYKDGEVVGKDAYNCDEFGECGNTVKYDFNPPKPVKGKKSFEDFLNLFDGGGGGFGYYIANGDVKDYTTPGKDEKLKTTYKGEGLVLAAGKEAGIKKVITPLNYRGLLVITARIAHVKGNADAKSGLVFAYTDDKNYYSFLVDKSGNYEVGNYTNGTYNELAKGTAYASDSDYDYDYYNYSDTKSKKTGSKEKFYEFYIASYKDTLQCFVGYTPVYKTTAFPGTGNYIGYKVAPGSAIKIKDMTVTKEIDAPFVSSDIDAKTIKHKAWKSTGSGFVVSTDGYIVTNHHVVDDANEIEIDLVRNGDVVSYQCDVVLKDEKSDLAVIKINDSTFTNFKSVPYTIQTELSATGTNVYALGYPFAMSTLGNELKYTEGSINARTGKDGDILAYQVSTPVQPGNSGGPLFDYDGNVIGVINSKLFYADNVAFAVKANYILNLLYLLPARPDYPEKTSLKGKSASEQVTILREFVPLIKVR